MITYNGKELSSKKYHTRLINLVHFNR